jgi:hypothetical protein
MRILRGAQAIVALALAGAASAQTQSAKPPPPPLTKPLATCNAPEFHAFDFWIGEWDAYEAAAPHSLAGRSSITREDNGCVISEHWVDAETAGYTGHSLNLYDRASGKWEQFWVDSTGEVTHFVGGPFKGGMQLTDPANRVGARPSPVQTRMTFTPLPDGSVRQHGQASLDNGKTWRERYDYIYRRRSGP